MQIVRRVHAMKEIARQARSRGLKLGLVPTMGYLHEGHLSLVRKTKELVDVVVVSIFVNPTQFGPDEDFERYPRDVARDTDLCIAENVDYLFLPEAGEMYPEGPRTIVEVEDLSARLEGVSRPGHFRGVCTVVLKLFSIVQPWLAAFGQKDAQQAVIVRRMTRDLLLDTEILLLPTVRDEDGLALSSRNRNLSDEQRRAALAIPRALEAAGQAAREGRRRSAELIQAARDVLEREERLTVDYVVLVDPERLDPVSQLAAPALLLVAAWAGGVRLIDNARIEAG
jgi:pantoate--beta-alanine ligase